MSEVVLDASNLSLIIGFIPMAIVVSFGLAPIMTHFLYKYDITVGRRGGYDPTLLLESRKSKMNTPTMGGILVIFTVAVITLLFNWERSFTWVPIGVMLLSAFLGALDDILNIFGTKRRSRGLKQTLLLIRVHHDLKARVWLAITLPWVVFKRMSMWIGSHPGKGVHVHEKLILQFLAGAITAWWIFFKLGEHWREIYIPFLENGGSTFLGPAGADSFLNIGILLIPLIIFVVMFTANAVNIADGMDGLAGGMLIPTFGSLLILSWMGGFTEVAILNATVVGALVTYTYFNIKPARFQMGDVGSLGLGALLAINAIVINQMVALVFLAFMFYVEALSVVLQIASRTIFGKKIFKMAPLHHHFELIGWSEEKVIMRFWIIHLAFVMTGIWIALH
ncbi:MAG: phospho-N-acetylmuramoyl-pentapeptide-transferase [bacterium]|nr:phospho-N-acetylmuramoyl-pentapeptide-transferase [bacterium]